MPILLLCHSTKSSNVTLSTTPLIASSIFFHSITVTHSFSRSHVFTSSSKHGTGHRLPSVNLKILPTVYSLGFLDKLYPPCGPLTLLT